MENAYDLYFHRLFSINPYRSLRMKLCEMSFCKDWPHTDRGEPYPIVREVGAALGEKVECGRIAFSADAPGERARLIGRFFPYASSEVCVDALDGEGARVGLEFAARAGRRGSPCTPEGAREGLESVARRGSLCTSEGVREGLEAAARGGSTYAPEDVREGLESAARGGSPCTSDGVREGLEAAARGGSTYAPEGARVGLEFAARSGSGSPYTAEDAPGLCVFVERAGAEVCVCHEEFVGGRSLGVVRHGTRAFTPGGVLFVSAHGAFFDVSLGREFVCTIQAEGFSDICRRSAFMNAGVSLYVALPAGGRAAVSRAESFLDGGLSHADMKPVRYEDGTPILENGRLFLTLSSRLQAGAYQYVVSWNPSTCELRPEGAIFFDYGDGRWCADVAISLLYHRERREWLFWATAFSHGHILCHGTSAGDPRFGITVLDAALMEAQKPGFDDSNGGLPIQTSGAEMADGLAQTKDCACGKVGAARAFASDDVLSVQAGGRVAEKDGELARTKECACGKAGAARAFASDDVLSVQAGERVAEMADGQAQTEECACGKAGAARAFASDDVLSAQAGWRGAEVAGGLARTKECACGKAGAARAFASDDVLSVQAGGRVAEMDGGQAQTKECACGKAGAARAFASDDVLSVQAGVARISASDEVLSVQAGGRVAEMADGLARTEDCACGKVGAARAFASDDVLSVQVGAARASASDDVLSVQAGGRGASVAELDDDTLWLAKTGDEDPDFTYDRERGKWYMTICRSVKGAGYRYFLFESDEPFSGYRHVCHTESGENTGGLMVCIRGRRALVCGSDFKARAEYRVYPLGDFSHFQRLTCDFDDGGFRGWGSLMPVPCGNRTKYVWMTFDRHNGSDYNWSYGNLYAYEAEEMDFQ